MRFLVSQDNGGGYRWALVAAGGERLAQSRRFSSYQEASEASHIARAGAASASIEEPSANATPVKRTARRKIATTPEDLGGEAR